MVTKLIIFFLFIITLPTHIFSQSSDEIQNKNKELGKLKEEILKLEHKLDDKSKQKVESISLLENINQQSLLLNRLINNLSREEQKKIEEISVLNLEINTLNKQIAQLRHEYANYIVWLYKQGSNSILKYLFTSASLNQAVVRYKYLSYITDHSEDNLKDLGSSLKKQGDLKVAVQKEIEEKNELIGRKKREQDILIARREEKEKLIEILKKDEGSLDLEIREKRKAEIKIKNIIADLVERERRRQAKIREGKLKNTSSPDVLSYNYDNFENFAALEGQLNWPVDERNIVRKFGENKNTKLNTVTLNYGVDILTSFGANVFAVAEGIVSAIDWIPGYGSVLIITHKNDFRTVYGHLSEITVNEGEQVTGGTVIGAVNESLEGNILHFEIWNERNYQNPEVWLVKK